MKLEDLAKPLDIADDFFHRGYSKLTKKWVDKGRSKYSLSQGFDYLSVVAHSCALGLGPNGPFLAVSLAFLHIIPSGVLSGVGIKLGEHPTGIKEVNGKYVVDNKFLYFIDSFWKTMRAPELTIGTGLIGKGIFDLYNYFVNNDSSSLMEGIEDLSLGTSLISNASAWYIRDSDPKVLDRKPLWKQELEKLRDKVGGYLPQPAPELIPIPVKPDRNYR